MNYMDIIDELRDCLGVSQVELAKLLGIQRSTYTNYKRYDRVMPIEHLNTIANYFNVSLDYLFDFATDKKYVGMKTILNQKAIGKRIASFRISKKLTQAELAQVLNTSQSVISDYESGNKLILTSFLFGICKEYNISADYLLCRIDKPVTITFKPISKEDI